MAGMSAVHRRTRPAAALRALAATAVAGALGLGGCTPTYNWRDVRLEAAGLAGWLPCKPDSAQRPMSFGGPDRGDVMLEMIGCETGGATFTLAHAHLDDPLEAGAALDRWRAATLARLGGSESDRRPLALAGTLALPQAGLSSVHARTGADGGHAIEARLAWFARADRLPGAGIELFQAAILGQRIDAVAAETFFSNLRLR